MQRLRTLMVSGFFLVAIGCGPVDFTPPEPSPPVNVIFIMVDTLRADHTSVHGYHRSTTPFLEQLAERSVVFERARAQAGCTFPSVNSILTSRYPFDFYRDGFTDMGIPEEIPSLAEILRGHGYATAAVSASPIVRATPCEFNPSAGFGRGFDVFDESCLWGSAKCVNQKPLEVLTTIEGPFFLYLHYMDPTTRTGRRNLTRFVLQTHLRVLTSSPLEIPTQSPRCSTTTAPRSTSTSATSNTWWTCMTRRSHTSTPCSASSSASSMSWVFSIIRFRS